MRKDTVPGTDYIIYQAENGFSYSLDSLALTSFARASGICADLGAGTGIISLRIAGSNLVKKVVAVEIQKSYSQMLEESIRENRLDHKIEVLNENVANLKEYFATNSFDTVLINPPYYDNYLKNLTYAKATARHGILDLKEFIKMAKYILKDKGRLYLVGPSTRAPEIFQIFENENIHVKKFCFVKKDQKSKSRVVLIEAIKGSKRGSDHLRDILIYEDENYSKDYESIMKNEVIL